MIDMRKRYVPSASVCLVSVLCDISSVAMLTSFLSILLLSSVWAFPSWEDLQCEDGHRYLFSETSLSWSEAVEECSLYGGWLVSINSLQEQNCLLRHGQEAGLAESWYWSDGKVRLTDTLKALLKMLFAIHCFVSPLS